MVGRRFLWIGLLCAAAAAGEGWSDLQRDWTLAMDKYEARMRRSPSKKTPHPFAEFAPRFRRFVQDHGNAPEALPAVLVLVQHTHDPNELHRLAVHLRETYVRSPDVGAAVPAIVRMGGEEGLRTLKDFAQLSPHDDVRGRARRGIRELQHLGISMRAPVTVGVDADGNGLDLEAYRGKVVVLLFGDGGRRKELLALRKRLKARPFAVLGAGTGDCPWPQWTETMRIAGAWNALDRPRLYVIDHESVIRGKDLTKKALEDLLRTLLAAAEKAK